MTPRPRHLHQVFQVLPSHRLLLQTSIVTAGVRKCLFRPHVQRSGWTYMQVAFNWVGPTMPLPFPPNTLTPTEIMIAPSLTYGRTSRRMPYITWALNLQTKTSLIKTMETHATPPTKNGSRLPTSPLGYFTK